LFDDRELPQALQVDDIFLQSVEDCICSVFLVPDLALADNLVISRSSGTKALAALVFGR
jgi:protein phosphatase 2C family protein 2/3